MGWAFAGSTVASREAQPLAHPRVLPKPGSGGVRAGRVVKGRANGPERLLEQISAPWRVVVFVAAGVKLARSKILGSPKTQGQVCFGQRGAREEDTGAVVSLLFVEERHRVLGDLG